MSERVRGRARNQHASPRQPEALQTPSAAKLVLCAGDSITRADVSGDWIGVLRSRCDSQRFRFVNAGANGNLAWNLLQRMDRIIQHEPDFVTVLIGTNDVLATYSPVHQAMYRRQQGIRHAPTLEWYLECFDAILRRLNSETSARVAVLDIPMLGEDLDSEINARVNVYNDSLRTLAAAHEVTTLPLHDAIVASLPDHHQPTPYAGKLSTPVIAAMKHRLLRRSWDDISTRNGLFALTDHIHLNDRAAAIVADLVAQFVGLPC